MLVGSCAVPLADKMSGRSPAASAQVNAGREPRRPRSSSKISRISWFGAMQMVRYVFRKGSHLASPASRSASLCTKPQRARNATPTTVQAGQSGSIGVHGSPHNQPATWLEATGATSIRCVWSVWRSSHDPRSGSRSPPIVRHASQAILVQARAYSATRADNGLTDTS